MNNQPLLDFQAARLGYGGSVVLNDVTVQMGFGECVGLVGPNGSGKTTFLKTVLGLLPPLGGMAWCDRSKRFAYVPQRDELDSVWPLTVSEVVELPLRARRMSPGSVGPVMERVGLTALGQHLFNDLSGGQRQRTLLAQALVQRPDVLLLDEPTKGLDVKTESDLLNLVDSLRREGLSILLVSHALHIPLNHTDKIFLFHEGLVIPTTPHEIFTTKKLEDVYGIPFLHSEGKGVKGVTPA